MAIQQGLLSNETSKIWIRTWEMWGVGSYVRRMGSSRCVSVIGHHRRSTFGANYIWWIAHTQDEEKLIAGSSILTQPIPYHFPVAKTGSSMCFITSQSAVDLGREQPILMPQVYFAVCVCEALHWCPAQEPCGRRRRDKQYPKRRRRRSPERIHRKAFERHACIHT